MTSFILSKIGHLWIEGSYSVSKASRCDEVCSGALVSAWARTPTQPSPKHNKIWISCITNLFNQTPLAQPEALWPFMCSALMSESKLVIAAWFSRGFPWALVQEDCRSLSVCVCAFLPVCLPVCLFSCLPACMSVYLPACLSTCMSVYLPACLSVLLWLGWKQLAAACCFVGIVLGSESSSARNRAFPSHNTYGHHTNTPHTWTHRPHRHTQTNQPHTNTLRNSYLTPVNTLGCRAPLNPNLRLFLVSARHSRAPLWTFTHLGSAHVDIIVFVWWKQITLLVIFCVFGGIQMFYLRQVKPHVNRWFSG